MPQFLIIILNTGCVPAIIDQQNSMYRYIELLGTHFEASCTLKYSVLFHYYLTYCESGRNIIENRLTRYP